MKIRLELEVPPDEADRVVPLLAAFQELSASLSRTSPSAKQAPASPVKPKRAADILLSASLSQQSPSSASAGLISARFSQAEISDAAIALLRDASQASVSTERAGLLVATVRACGEGAMKVFTQGFVGNAVRELMIPREYGCDRREFYGFATGLVALAEIGRVAPEAVVRTVTRLLEDDTRWVAGVTLFCLLLERDVVKGDLQEVRELLKEMADVDAFRYDIGYVNSITRWEL